MASSSFNIESNNFRSSKGPLTFSSALSSLQDVCCVSESLSLFKLLLVLSLTSFEVLGLSSVAVSVLSSAASSFTSATERIVSVAHGPTHLMKIRRPHYKPFFGSILAISA
jgi:hypothetical protein